MRRLVYDDSLDYGHLDLFDSVDLVDDTLEGVDQKQAMILLHMIRSIHD